MIGLSVHVLTLLEKMHWDCCYMEEYAKILLLQIMKVEHILLLYKYSEFSTSLHHELSEPGILNMNLKLPVETNMVRVHGASCTSLIESI